jgi:hypothetical protein
VSVQSQKVRLRFVPLCNQTLILLLHWLKTTNFPETATRAIDFSADGLSGIGPLAAPNFNGVCIIIPGEKGKAGAEDLQCANATSQSSPA